MIRILSIIFFFILISCSKPSVSIDSCTHLSKVSVEYVKCLENLVKKTNTAANIKEFGKHKTGSSFFKKVIVNTLE